MSGPLASDMVLLSYHRNQLLWGLRNDEFEKQALEGRKFPCGKCGSKKKYFCEKCTEIVGDATHIPSVRFCKIVCLHEVNECTR